MVGSARSDHPVEDDSPVHFLEEIPSMAGPLESARTFDFGLSPGKI